MKTNAVYKQEKKRPEFLLTNAEGNISRRDWFKRVVGVIGLLALGEGVSSCGIFKRIETRRRLKDFWKRVDEIQAGNLVDSVIRASKAQIEYSNWFAESERAVALQGSEVGKEERKRAEEFFQKRTEELRNAKTALARLVSKIDKSTRTDFNKALNDLGADSLKADAREFAINRLVSGIGIVPDDATEAMQKLDSNLEPIAGLRSFEDVTQLLDQRLDDLIDKKFGNPGIARGLCILLLVITSMYIILIVLAVLVLVLVCIITLGFACDSIDLQDIVDDMINDICGPA